MPSDLDRDRRRSTRIRLKVAIEAQGVAEPLKCEGETEVVNLHGAFISMAVPLRVGMTVDVRVMMTGKCARATVVYVDREQPRYCGISLEHSQNIWGILVPPDDWAEGQKNLRYTFDICIKGECLQGNDFNNCATTRTRHQYSDSSDIREASR